MAQSTAAAKSERLSARRTAIPTVESHDSMDYRSGPQGTQLRHAVGTVEREQRCLSGFSHSSKYRPPQAFQHRLARCVAQSGRVPKRVVSILRGHGSGELSAKVALTYSSTPLQLRVEDGTLVLYYSFHVHYQRVQSGPDEIAPF